MIVPALHQLDLDCCVDSHGSWFVARKSKNSQSWEFLGTMKEQLAYWCWTWFLWIYYLLMFSGKNHFIQTYKRKNTRRSNTSTAWRRSQGTQVQKKWFFELILLFFGNQRWSFRSYFQVRFQRIHTWHRVKGPFANFFRRNVSKRFWFWWFWRREHFCAARGLKRFAKEILS